MPRKIVIFADGTGQRGGIFFDGPQHDEKRIGVYRHTRTLVRKVPSDAILHQSVLDRFELSQVLQYNVLKPYRPKVLRDHEQVKHHYEAEMHPAGNDRRLQVGRDILKMRSRASVKERCPVPTNPDSEPARRR